MVVKTLSGKTSASEKTKTIESFVGKKKTDGMNVSDGTTDIDLEPSDESTTEKECRVLCMSSVGNAGLNLHSAKAVIFMVRREFCF